jgi:hypothetical protein
MKIREIVERAESPFIRAMRVDPTAYDFGNAKGLGDNSIQMQLMKNVDRQGNRPIVFLDGSEMNLSGALSHKILLTLGELLPRERHIQVRRIIKSPDNLKQFIHQYVKR